MFDRKQLARDCEAIFNVEFNNLKLNRDALSTAYSKVSLANAYSIKAHLLQTANAAEIEILNAKIQALYCYLDAYTYFIKLPILRGERLIEQSRKTMSGINQILTDIPLNVLAKAMINEYKIKLNQFILAMKQARRLQLENESKAEINEPEEKENTSSNFAYLMAGLGMSAGVYFTGGMGLLYNGLGLFSGGSAGYLGASTVSTLLSHCCKKLRL